MLLGTQRINDQNHLEIGGVDVVDLATEFGTPLYVMDEAAIRQRAREYRRAFQSRYPNTRFAFAGKAFLCTGFCRIVEQEGFDLEVASGGELYTALQAGFPVERIALHGNNKTDAELRMALDAGIGYIIVDNLLELERLAEITVGRERPQPILLRLAPGIDPHTHRLISTGQVDSKFGIDMQGEAALEAVRRASEIASLELRGLHCHVGSQLLDMEAHLGAIGIVVDFLAAARDKLGLVLPVLNIGGGLGIRYLESHDPPSLEEFAAALTDRLRAALRERDYPAPELQLEPGRSLVGEAGTTLYTVGAIKTIPGVRTYVTVDGGLSDNPRPALYQAEYSILLADRLGDEADSVVTVSGKHCETDRLFPDVRLPMPRPGDLLAVQSTGAYNYVMASNYNRYPRPAVVLVNEGQADLLVRRETYEDLVRCDVVPARLA